MDSNLSKEKITNNNAELQIKLNQLEKELRLADIKLKDQLDAVKKEYEACIQKLTDQEIKSNVKIESLKSQNLILKNELISTRSAKSEIDQNLNESNQIVNKQNEELNKLNTNISNWSYKYKCLMEKTKKIEDIEAIINKDIKLVIEENKNLSLIIKHNDCLVEIIKQDNSKIIKELQEKVLLKDNQIDDLNKRIAGFELNKDLLSKQDKELQENLMKIKKETELLQQQNTKLEDDLAKTNQMLSSNSSKLIEQKNLNLSLENDLKEKLLCVQRVKEERNSISFELNETVLKYDIQIEELKNQVKKYVFKYNKECEERERMEKLITELREQLQMNQINLKKLNDKNNKLMYDNSTQTLTSYKTKQMFTQTLPIHVRNVECQTETSKTIPLRDASNSNFNSRQQILDDSDVLPDIDLQMSNSFKPKSNDISVIYKNRNVLYKNDMNINRFISNDEFNVNNTIGTKSRNLQYENELDRMRQSNNEDLKTKKVRFSDKK